MTTDVPKVDVLPAAAQQFLTEMREALRERKTDRIRLYPLVLNKPLETLIRRRSKRLFDVVQYDPKEYGFEVTFKRHLKRSKNHPDGRDCQGLFHLLSIDQNIVLVASSLTGDDHKHGPRRFTDKAYPLARRPFFPSTTLIRLVEQFASARNCTATTLDAWGYHRQSHRPRRDLERQAPAEAAREMAEQGRQIHQTVVSYKRDRREIARLSFDRNATLTMFKGSLVAAVKELVLSGIAEATKVDSTYEVTRTIEPAQQEIVELAFADEPFDDYDAMHSLCEAPTEL